MYLQYRLHNYRFNAYGLGGKTGSAECSGLLSAIGAQLSGIGIVLTGNSSPCSFPRLPKQQHSMDSNFFLVYVWGMGWDGGIQCTQDGHGYVGR